MTSKSSSATLSRDESNILVAIGKLETQMDGIRTDLAGARVEIKEINTGITARLLNLEANSVSKIVVDNVEARVTSLEDSRITYRAQIKTWGIVWAFITFVGPIVLAIYLNNR